DYLKELTQRCLAEATPKELSIHDRKQEKSKEFPAKEKKLTNKTCGATSIRKIIRSAIDPVHTIVEISKGQFCISVPVGKDFKPENLDVKIKDRVAIVEMKIEQTSEDGTSILSQVFTKKITLPEEAKLEEVKSRLTPEGVLKIEVPLPVPENPSKPQAVEIPVTMEVEDSSLSNQS
ncbi:unnamed protein product, partial [Allacma fusca]